MAESYSIEAVLSARDAGFTAGMKAAGAATESLAGKIKSGLGFGALMTVGSKALSVVTGSLSGLGKETIETSDSMQKLQQAMRFSGYSEKQVQRIAGATGTLKTYADKTVFSLEDVMSTFGALSANGIKNADKLTESVGNAVAVFGGGAQEYSSVALAFSQAMAAGALHAQDWNQILNASPQLAGGLRKELMKLNPTIAKDFKGAMEKGVITSDLLAKAMNNIGMTKMAKEAATSVTTFEGAMGNLEATVVSGMMNIYDSFAKSAVIDGINAFNSKLETGFNWLSANIPKAINAITPYWNVFKSDVLKVGSAFGSAVGAIGKSLAKLNGSFGSAKSINGFKSVMSGATGALTKFAGFCEEHSDAIAKLINVLPKLLIAYKGFKIVKSIAPGVGAFGSAIGGLAKKGLGKIAPNLFKVSEAQETVGKSSTTSSKKILTSAKAFMMFGAGVLMIGTGFSILAKGATELASSGGVAIAIFVGMAGAVSALSIGMLKMVQSVSATPKKLTSVATAFMAIGASILMASTGFWLLSNAAINLASAGEPAIAVMIGMVGAIAGLAAGASILGPALTAGAVGFVAFGAGIALVGAGALLASAALYVLAAALPAIVQYGASGAVAIAALGGGMIVFATGAVVAGAASIVLGAGLLAVGAGSLVAAVGVLALGAATVVLGAGCLMAGAGIALLAAGLPVIASSGLAGAGALMALGAGMITFSVGTVAGGAACVVLGAGLATVGAGALVASTGVLTLAAGVLLLGAGMAVVAASVTVTASSLTTVATGATTSAAAFTALLGAALSVGATLITASAGFIVLGAGAIAATAGVVAFGAGMVAGAVGTLAMAASLKSVNSSMKSISSNAKSAKGSLSSMQKSVNAVNSGLNALGSKASSALNKLTSSFNNAASKAKSSGQKVGNGFADGMKSGLNKAPSVASSSVKSVADKLRSGYSAARSAGAYISQGFASGMQSCLGQIRSAAAQMVAAADAAIRAKAKIHSPSRVTRSHGYNMAVGLGLGMAKGISYIRKTGKSMVDAALSTLTKATKTREYETAADTAIDKIQTKIESQVSKQTKSVTNTLSSYIKKLKKQSPRLKKAYSQVEKVLKSNITSSLKKEGQKLINAADKALTALGEKYQEKYDEIINDRKNYYSQLSDYGDLYSVDSYGFVSLKDFSAQEKQVKSLASNMKKLKGVLPYDLMADIQNMDTATALSYTNELLKKDTSWLKKYGKSYTSLMSTANKESKSYYKSYITSLDSDYNKAVKKELKKLKTKMNDIGKQAVSGFVSGLKSKSSQKALKKVSSSMANTIIKTIKSKLKIHSPSRVLMSLGEYTVGGFVKGIEGMGTAVEDAMNRVITIPDIQTPALAGNYNFGELSSDYDYYRNVEYTIVVPVEIDGKETAKVLAKYTQDELDRMESRENRKRGRR